MIGVTCATSFTERPRSRLQRSSRPIRCAARLAASASALFEATPFVAGGRTPLVRCCAAAAPLFDYLGCGCGDGPSARSLPAAAATWLVFGARVAIARYLAALLAARILRRRFAPASRRARNRQSAARARRRASGRVDRRGRHAVLRFDRGASRRRRRHTARRRIGLLRGALRTRRRRARRRAARARSRGRGGVPLRRRHRRSSRASCRLRRAELGDDAFAYALLALALGIVAWRGGDALVHPAFALPLACCAVVALACACARRRARCAPARFAPALMLAGSLLGAPPPQYHATETTLADLFAGERLDVYRSARRATARTSAIVRYAITCCRADAAPVAVRLDARTAVSRTARGCASTAGSPASAGQLRLVAERVERVAAPTDPFLYR